MASASEDIKSFLASISDLLKAYGPDVQTDSFQRGGIVKEPPPRIDLPPYQAPRP